MRYVHYGSSKFDPNRWTDVRGSEGGFLISRTAVYGPRRSMQKTGGADGV